ncbi:epimerase [Geobacter sp. FeAm09]|uniref:epimerase n=1 Tax=Geobacter sp. FeAm09 TaxID=2597769 RepID=UPI0011ECCFD6|nr:epimerase [Geobacter sp. FeAm09]QEM70128.1 epimerase [Geobacter sp. FeAm09]
MRVLLFGATGMVGQGVLRECLLDGEVAFVQTVGRTATGVAQPKLRELLHPDLWHYGAIEGDLTGFDACFFCLGTSSAGKGEAEYTRITYDLAMAAAQTLVRLNPHMTFVYVSGVGADSSEQGRVMWARVRGRLENALMRLPFRGVYIFRPGAIQPLHGIESKTKSYRLLYRLLGPVLPLLRRAFPGRITTTERIGRAMLRVARYGADRQILESRDLETLAV